VLRVLMNIYENRPIPVGCPSLLTIGSGLSPINDDLLFHGEPPVQSLVRTRHAHPFILPCMSILHDFIISLHMGIISDIIFSRCLVNITIYPTFLPRYVDHVHAP
jgi:hypothetical protein